MLLFQQGKKMGKNKQIRLSNIGSFYNVPNWRHQLYLNPGKAGLAEFCEAPEYGAGCLKRYLRFSDVREGLTVNNIFPATFQGVVNSLGEKNLTLFYKFFHSKLKKEKKKKLTCGAFAEKKLVWRVKQIDALNDPYLKRLLYHAVNFNYDPYIQFAVDFMMSKEHQHIFKAIGYHVYAELSDGEIAKRFKLYPQQIAVIRNLFFDFTHAPKNSTAQAAYFTQLAESKIITDIDRRFYKLIFELGELGLRAHASFHTLTPDEKVVVEQYLGNTMLENVFSLNFSINDVKDSLNFNSVINNLASFYIKKEEVNYYRAKVRNLDAGTQRITSERNSDFSGIDAQDEEALKLIGKLALRENSLPSYPAITELN